MRICGENLVGLRCHEGFDTGVIFQGHQKGLSKVGVCLGIIVIVRLRKIWHEALFKLGVLFDGMLSRKGVFSESTNRSETHIDMVVRIIEVQYSVSLSSFLVSIS